MSIKNRIINIAGISLIFLVNLNLAEASEGIDMSGTIVRLISFLLGICGATYLAAGLWQNIGEWLRDMEIPLNLNDNVCFLEYYWCIWYFAGCHCSTEGIE